MTYVYCDKRFGRLANQFQRNFVRKTSPKNLQTATNEMVRKINGRIVLNLVRKHQPVSRSDLVRYSGLQRSTVSAITGQLIIERWLKEGPLGNLPRGRKPIFLRLNPERCGIIGVDIQPDNTTVVLANLDSSFLAQESMPTEKNPAHFMVQLSHRITNLLRAHPHDVWEGVGICLPGRVDSSRQQLIFSSALGWSKVDLKSLLEDNVGLPVAVENVANACALAERWSGRHLMEVHNLVAVAVSDVIEVGMVLNRQLTRGSNGMAGEFGHVTLVPGGPQCRCGNSGCWEVLASNSAAVRYYTESAFVGKGQASPGNTTKPSLGDIIRLAARNDVRACKALDRMAYYLGAGIAMLITGLAPEVVVVVGEIACAWDKVGPIVAATVERHSFSHTVTRVISAKPELQLQLRGAVALILQKHFASPLMG